VWVTILVDDAYQTVARAVAEGARFGKIVDPFGHEWGINQQVKEQRHEETQAAADAFLAKRQQCGGRE
jgi:hypothetical protein